MILMKGDYSFSHPLDFLLGIFLYNQTILPLNLQRTQVLIILQQENKLYQLKSPLYTKKLTLKMQRGS